MKTSHRWLVFVENTKKMKIHLREERMAENGEDGKDGMHYDFENLQNAFFFNYPCNVVSFKEIVTSHIYFRVHDVFSLHTRKMYTVFITVWAK